MIEAGAFKQTTLSPEMKIVEKVVTETVAEPLKLAVHELKVGEVTLTKVYVLLVLSAGVVMEKEPLELRVSVWFDPPSIV